MTAVAAKSRWLPDGRLDLPEVTLVAATSVALDATQAALRACAKQIRFSSVRLLSDKPPRGPDAAAIEWRQIAPLRSRAAYSRFMLHDLCDHIETPFALIVQWDGFVIDATKWRDAFLDFDYIGAPWPQFTDGGGVGNGGFSLRSRRLAAACRMIAPSLDEAEDVAICRTWRARLEAESGIRIAPAALAAKFAYERTQSHNQEFGFHGVFNLMHRMRADEFGDLLAGLESGVLGRREAKEIMQWALSGRHWRSLGHALRIAAKRALVW